MLIFVLEVSQLFQKDSKHDQVAYLVFNRPSLLVGPLLHPLGGLLEISLGNIDVLPPVLGEVVVSWAFPNICPATV